MLLFYKFRKNYKQNGQFISIKLHCSMVKINSQIKQKQTFKTDEETKKILPKIITQPTFPEEDEPIQPIISYERCY